MVDELCPEGVQLGACLSPDLLRVKKGTVGIPSAVEKKKNLPKVDNFQRHRQTMPLRVIDQMLEILCY